MSISSEDQKRISAAIHAAEANTAGEIVCVLARTSTHATALPIFLAAVVTLVMPWLLMSFTAMTVSMMLTLQIVVFIGLVILFTITPLRLALIPRKARRAIAHRLAMEQFIARGIGQKNNCSGILIFVSLAERYARIIVDDTIASRVPQTKWQGAVDALIRHMRDGRIADGFVTAIELCSNELAAQFPRTAASSNALPDKIYLI
jgi:putative membrane protein